MILRLLSFIYVFFSWVVFAQMPLDLSSGKQKFVVAAPRVMHTSASKAQTQLPSTIDSLPSRPSSSQGFSADTSTLLNGSLIAQQAAVAALSFSGAHAQQLEQLALQYFSPQAWGQFMTPEVRKARRTWQHQGYVVTVLIKALPEITPTQLKNQTGLRAYFPILVEVFQGKKLVADQRIQMNLVLMPIQHYPFWQVQEWSSALLSNASDSEQSVRSLNGSSH
jgi:hypothetical protein